MYAPVYSDPSPSEAPYGPTDPATKILLLPASSSITLKIKTAFSNKLQDKFTSFCLHTSLTKATAFL